MQCKSSKISQRPQNHVREISLDTGAISNQVRNSKVVLSVSVPGQKLGTVKPRRQQGLKSSVRSDDRSSPEEVKPSRHHYATVVIGYDGGHWWRKRRFWIG